MTSTNGEEVSSLHNSPPKLPLVSLVDYPLSQLLLPPPLVKGRLMWEALSPPPLPPLQTQGLED
jgi:hypothetical protein